MKCSQREKFIFQNLQSEFLNKTSVVGHLLNANLQALENYLNLSFNNSVEMIKLRPFDAQSDQA